MILYISKELLKKHTKAEIFEKGYFYYIHNHITKYEIDYFNNVILAQVEYGEAYDIKINYSLELKQMKCNCSCNEKRSSLCEHLVAVLLETSARDHAGEFENPPYALGDRSVIRLFEKPLNADTSENLSPKQTVRLSQAVEFFTENSSFDNPYRHVMSAEISFKAGISKLYVIRNIHSFLNSVFDGLEFEAGKQFRFIPDIHRFNERDYKLLSFLYYTVGHYDKPWKEDCRLSGKKALLSGVMLEKYLDICLTDPTDIEFTRYPSRLLTVDCDGEPEVEFKLREVQSSILLDVRLDKDVWVSENAKYVIEKDRLIRTKGQTAQVLKNVKKMMADNQKDRFLFAAPHTGGFFMHVLPKLNALGHVDIDEKLMKKIVNDELTIICKFDKYRNNILLDVELKYGNTVINQATDEIKEGDKDIYLMRNYQKEMMLQSLIRSCGFVPDKDRYVLSSGDKIYEFLKRDLSKFLEIGQVYYSEAFKNMPIRRPSLFMTMSVENNWLDVQFTTEDMSEEDLFGLLSSIRHKKKYYRLKNGEFLDLDFEQGSKWAEILDRLDIERNDIANRSAHLPVYRALYMDNLLKDETLRTYISGTPSFKKLIENIGNYDLSGLTVPESLVPVLRRYQVTGFKWMKQMTDCGMGVILADDMGLGKTLQILTLLLAHKESLQKAGLKPRPSLIVVPTSLTYNWVAEIEKFTPSLTVQTLTGTPSQREALLNDCQDTDILLTTYGMIRRDAELYEGIEFEYCILDESQHIKNPMSIGAKGVKTIRAKKRIAMTGTPIENNIIELWSVFDFIMPGFFGSLHKFNKRFANGNEEDVTRTLRAMTSPFIIRRIKSDVLEELPEKIITKMDCELTQEQKELYMAYLTLAKQQISSDEDINQKRFSILSTLLRLRQICCHPSMFIDNYKGGSGKIELFNEVVEQAVTSGHRVLVFSQFTSMLDILKKELDKQGFTYFYLDGTVPANERIDSVNRFNEGERQLFLISLKAGGFGLNLTGADVVIHYDPWWNPAVENQATDRAHRIGQKKTVHVIRLVAKGTIEDKILSLQDKKQALVDSILEAGDSVPNRLDLEEILELLQTE
jgi:SNF2 family DNA or RNA helicase